MRRAALAAIALLLLDAAFAVAAGARLESAEALPVAAGQELRLSGAGPDLALDSAADSVESLLEASRAAADDASRRDAAKMFLLSLAVPGGGQIVQGQKRGYLYLAAEIAFWGAYYVLNEKGNEEVDEFKAYADTHWDFAGYADWYDIYCVNCVGDTCGSDYDCRELAPYGSGEYYEDIGKYSTYWRWWSEDGAGSWNPEYLEIRDIYWEMRRTSNRHLRNARYYMTAAFLNHVVSAVDALLFPGRRSEGAGGSASIEFDVPENATGLRCALVARY